MLVLEQMTWLLNVPWISVVEGLSFLCLFAEALASVLEVPVGGFQWLVCAIGAVGYRVLLVIDRVGAVGSHCTVLGEHGCPDVRSCVAIALDEPIEHQAATFEFVIVGGERVAVLSETLYVEAVSPAGVL